MFVLAITAIESSHKRESSKLKRGQILEIVPVSCSINNIKPSMNKRGLECDNDGTVWRSRTDYRVLSELELVPGIRNIPPYRHQTHCHSSLRNTARDLGKAGESSARVAGEV